MSAQERQEMEGGHVIGSSGLNAPGAVFYGDVSISGSAVPTRAGTVRPEYNDRLLLSFLQKELRKSSRARMLDPTPGREQYSLADVFVDLDTSLVPDPQSAQENQYRAVGYDNETFPFLARQLSLKGAFRTVLTGGPGQGKTTAAQMLAQIHRCSVLRNFDPEVLSPQTTAELERVDQLLRRLGLALPSCARLPLWIEAEALTVYLGRSPDVRRSLWHFLAERHERILNTPVTAGAIRALAESRPTLLVLDGYDEVSTQYRNAVMEHVMDFADEMQMARANAATVVTSRPQAYENELRPHRFVAWSLNQLTPEEAERHAATLVGPGVEGRQLVRLFREALRSTFVLELLNTPLHVALLVALLAGSGPPPTGRHRLFSRYYDHVYLREQGRGGLLGAFLEKNRHLVDELHRRTAFRILATAGNGSDQGITPDEFTEIARTLVSEAGVADGEQKADVVQKLIRFARERLVLIVGIDSDEVGFQIKSFTEFLAAAHLARTSDEYLVRERFRAVAASEPWQNVARFMAAAAFETDSLDERDLRDSVVTTLAELDRKELAGSDALLLRGAEMAMELLSDVPGMDGKYRQRLIPSSQMIESLGRRSDTLATVAASEFGDQRIADLVVALYASRKGCRNREAVWRFLNKLAEHGNTAAVEVARRYAYSADPEELPRMLWEIAIPQVVSPEELVGLLRRADPNAVTGSSRLQDVKLPMGWASSAWDLLHGASARLRCEVDLEGLWHLMGPNSLQGWLSDKAGLSKPPAECHPHWLAWAQVCRALSSPTPAAIESLLHELPNLKERRMSKNTPWPIQEALKDASQSGPLAVDAWYTAEGRWREQGVRLHDMETYLEHGALGHRVATSGFPFGAVHWSMPGQHEPQISALAHDVWRIWHDHRERRSTYSAHVARNVLLPMCDYGLEYDVDTLSPQQVREVISAIPDANDIHITFQAVHHALSECSSDKEFSAMAARLAHWEWSKGPNGADVLSLPGIVERASRVLDPETFRRLCRKIAIRSVCSLTWGELTAYWIERTDSGHADWPLTNLLRVRGKTPERCDIASAAGAVESKWSLFDLADNVPFWSEEVREWIREQFLVQIGEPWMTYAPAIWSRTRQPAQPFPLSDLRLSIP